jgi:hypothetical protein
MRQPLNPQQESASSEKPPKTLKSDSSFVFFGVVREKPLLFRLYFEALQPRPIQEFTGKRLF